MRREERERGGLSPSFPPFFLFTLESLERRKRKEEGVRQDKTFGIMEEEEKEGGGKKKDLDFGRK